MSLPLLTEPQSLQQNELVRREAIVQLADLDIFGGNTSLAHSSLRRSLGHVKTDEIHRARREKSRRVGHQLLACHQDRLAAQVRFSIEESLRDDDRRSCPVARGTALQLRDRVVDHGRLFHFLQSVLLPKLSVGVALRVLVADASYLGEIFRSSSIPVQTVSSSQTNVLTGITRRTDTSPYTPSPH